MAIFEKYLAFRNWGKFQENDAEVSQRRLLGRGRVVKNVQK